jgi:hypothetical protein
VHVVDPPVQNVTGREVRSSSLLPSTISLASGFSVCQSFGPSAQIVLNASTEAAIRLATP